MHNEVGTTSYAGLLNYCRSKQSNQQTVGNVTLLASGGKIEFAAAVTRSSEVSITPPHLQPAPTRHTRRVGRSARRPCLAPPAISLHEQRRMFLGDQASASRGSGRRMSSARGTLSLYFTMSFLCQGAAHGPAHHEAPGALHRQFLIRAADEATGLTRLPTKPEAVTRSRLPESPGPAQRHQSGLSGFRREKRIRSRDAAGTVSARRRPRHEERRCQATPPSVTRAAPASW